MAKSKSGGTRAMLRGRIASDVYSIGKDGAGKKQQIVRSLAEQVSNPRTSTQMRGRMIMSTVMQFIAASSEILNHAFDGVAVGQPSLSVAIRENYSRIKADVAANFSSGNSFGLNLYGEKGAKQGKWLVSDGKVAVPAAVQLAGGVLTLTASGASLTVAALRSALGFGVEDYVTLVGVSADGSFHYCRLHIADTAANDTVVTADNINDVIALDGNVAMTLAINGQSVTLTDTAIADCCGVIVTKKVASEFYHSTCVLTAPDAPANTAAVALPTYPVGSAKFLNGGDTISSAPQNAAGSVEEEEENTGGGGDSPTPDGGGENG